MTRETYDIQRERWRFHHDAFRGGQSWQFPSATTLGSAQVRWSTIDSEGNHTSRTRDVCSYLVPHEGESGERFTARHALALYVNPCAPIVRAYAEGITARVTRSTGALTPFLEDADQRGSAWGEVVESTALWACTYGLVATVVDSPREDVSQMSEAERSARGIQPYVVTVHPPSWAWVECEDGRVVEFAYVSTPYRATLSTNARVSLEVRVWRADRVIDGERVAGGWEVRRGEVAGAALSELGNAASALSVVDSGPLPSALAGEIPVTFAYCDRDHSSECPSGHGLIADAAQAGRVIYNTLSWIAEIDRLAAFPFLAIPLRDTGGQLDQATAHKIGPGQALGHAGSAGTPQWVEPSGTSQTGMLARCIAYYQWAMRSAGLELAADTSAQVQSGEALRIRSRDFESRALRIARNLQRWEVATLKLFARLAGTSPDEIEVAYAKRITHADPSEDVQRALTVLTAPVEVGPEARSIAALQLLDAALSLSDEQQSEIGTELREMFGADLAAYSAKQTVERMRSEREATGLAQVDEAPAVVAPPTSEAPAVEAVADTALNGAQVASLLQIIGAINPGAPMPIETARSVIAAAFPSFDDARIAAMLTPIRNQPAPVAPAAPAQIEPVVTDGATNAGQ